MNQATVMMRYRSLKSLVVKLATTKTDNTMMLKIEMMSRKSWSETKTLNGISCFSPSTHTALVYVEKNKKTIAEVKIKKEVRIIILFFFKESLYLKRI
tara:strand:+ start:2019 stop:2312 length:294 start_codon:yes stop_codon:yes gene_type:complete